jgi:hypothetical protein
MTQWWPTVAQERWLEVGARLRSVPRDAITRRAAGWRAVGPFARIALFGLGVVSAGLLVVIIGLQQAFAVLGGLGAVGVSEWLKVRRRVHGSGFEEGLAAAGWLLIALWTVSHVARPGAYPELMLLLGGCAAAIAGVRLLNPFLTACAAIAWLYWCDSTPPSRLLASVAGAGALAFALGCGGATIALAAGSRTYRRPSQDHMLDWLVVVLPLAGYLRRSQGEPWRSVASVPSSTHAHAVTALVLAGLALVMVAVALRRRRHAPLLAGLGCITCAIVEATRLVPWPIEVCLIVAGLLAIALAAVVDRRLRDVQHGVTSARIEAADSVIDLLQTAGTSLVTPRLAEAPELGTAPSGQGGRFGGGGASGDY